MGSPGEAKGEKETGARAQMSTIALANQGSRKVGASLSEKRLHG
jgi:hypothetical protein